MPKFDWDFFICHASEDKESIVRPLALALRRRGLKVWFDEFSLRAGDSLEQSISKGLSKSNFGIVVLSPHFFKNKKWARTEFSGLFNRQMAEERKLIIPIWHNITQHDILTYSPSLADLVAIPSNLSIPKMVEKLINSAKLNLQNIDLKKILPTGIIELDQALKGGLPRPCSIVIIGPKGIGKTKLALQIQMAALDRLEPCVYIAYREPPVDIIRHMLRLGAPLNTYVEEGNFKILDNYSAPNEITHDRMIQGIDPIYHSLIVRVENPNNKDEYYKLQCELMEEMGMGKRDVMGVNIIDSTNDRYRMLKFEEKKLEKSVSKYFHKFKTMFGKLGGQSGLHIATEMEGEEGFYKLLSDLQDGTIRMRYEENSQERQKYIRVESLREGWHDHREFEFIITDNGIEILEEG